MWLLTTQRVGRVQGKRLFSDVGFHSMKDLNFHKFRMLTEIGDVLNNEMNIQTPTPIQTLSISHLAQGNSALLAAQTGTGKTLAYSLPVIHRLKQSELHAKTQLTEPNRPRSLVLVPNRELSVQVLESGFKPFSY